MADCTAFTDGSCMPNPGAGGWAYVLLDRPGVKIAEGSGGERSTSNNRMELRAVIEAIKCVPEGQSVRVYTDSLLTISCATGVWKRKKNKDLWAEFDAAIKSKIVTFQWVRGHSGNHWNEIVDRMAGDARLCA